MKRYLIFLVAFALVFSGVAFAKDKTVKPIMVGLAPTTSGSGFYLAKVRGYFKEQGLNVKIAEFGKSGAEIFPLLAADKLQVGGGSLSPGLFNAVHQGIGARVVADKALIDPKDSHDAILVRKDLVDSGKVKTGKDFKGLKVAMASPGLTNGMSMGLVRFLALHGLTEKDVKIVSIPYPQMVGALQYGQVDAACAIEPFIAKAVDMGAAVRFHGFEETIPNFQVAVVYYSEGFMKNRPDDARKFMVAYVKGLRDYINAFRHGVDTDRTIDDLSSVLKVKEKSLYRKMRAVGFNPDGYVNKKAMDEGQDFWFNHGYVKVKVPVENVVDDAWCDYAVKVLGKYQPPTKK